MIRKTRVFLTALMSILSFALLDQAVFAYTPPAGSPLAEKIHPRLYFISDAYKATHPSAVGSTPSEMRTKLTVHFKNNGIFQNWINMLDSRYANSPPTDEQEVTHGGINYAFIYLIDQSDPLMSNNFSFGHTRAEYAGKAVQYAKAVIAQGFNDGYKTTKQPVAMTIGLVYDWVYPDLTLADKRFFADWFISTSEGGRSDSDLGIFMPFNIGSGANHGRGVGALSFWGDPLDDGSTGSHYANKGQALLDEMNQVWIVNSFGALQNVHLGANWQEGYGYHSHSFIKLMFFTGLARTALNTDYFSNIPYFKENILFYLYSIRPRLKGNANYLYKTILDGERKAQTYQEHPYIYTGMHNGIDNNFAGLGKWLLDNGHGRKKSRSGSKLYDMYSFSRWTKQVMFRFIWSHEDGVVAKSPSNLGLQLTKKLGFGMYMLRTGFDDQDDTLIGFHGLKFYARRMDLNMSSFTIEKFGNLILDPAGPKSGSYSVHCSKKSFCENSVTVYDALESNSQYGGLGSNGFSSAIYPSPAFNEGGGNHAGDVVAEEINNGKYDYIDYDWTKSWDPQKVDYADRKFLYLRGGVNSEYVIVLDRINTVDANHIKRTTFWMPYQPKSEDGSFTLDSTGHWSSTNTRIVSQTNRYVGNNSHGRLFLKALLPDNPVIERIGGPGHEFDDLEKNSLWKSNAGMTDEIAEWFGSYRIQIRPSTPKNYDVFLSVMQIGDADTLSSMTDTIKVESSDGKMVGTHIRDSANQWAVLFAKNKGTISVAQYVLNGTGTINHLLTDLQPSTNYDIRDNGTLVLTKPSSSSGTLNFTSNLGSSHTFQIVAGGAVIDTTPPGVPSGLSVN